MGDENDCPMCDEPVLVSDLVAPATCLTPEGPRRMHAECALRNVVGGIGHHQDHVYWCLHVHDPDAGLSYRESARRVWALYRDQDPGGGSPGGDPLGGVP